MIFFIRLSSLIIPYNIVQKSLRRWKIFCTILYGVTKRLSRIKKIINFHHQFFKRYPTPSTINVKNHFHISDLDSYNLYTYHFYNWFYRLKVHMLQGQNQYNLSQDICRGHHLQGNSKIITYLLVVYLIQYYLVFIRSYFLKACSLLRLLIPR